MPVHGGCSVNAAARAKQAEAERQKRAEERAKVSMPTAATTHRPRPPAGPDPT